MELKEIYHFFKHPIRYIVHNSKDYKESLKEREDLKTNIRGLNQKINSLEKVLIEEEKSRRRIYEDLKTKEQELEKFQKNYIPKAEYDKLKKEYEELSRRYAKILSEIPKIKETISKTLKVCRDIHTSRDVIEERVKENYAKSRALEEWIMCEKAPLEKRMKIAEKEAEVLRGFAFSTAINDIINLHPKTRKIPIAYYDFANKMLYYNCAVLKFLDIEEKKEQKELTLNGLLSYIDRNEVKKEIVKSLKERRKLEHFKTKTSGKKQKELILTTLPFFYNNQAIGMGIFLHGPRFFGHRFKIHKITREVEDVFKIISSEFNKLSKQIKKENNTMP